MRDTTGSRLRGNSIGFHVLTVSSRPNAKVMAVPAATWKATRSSRMALLLALDGVLRMGKENLQAPIVHGYLDRLAADAVQASSSNLQERICRLDRIKPIPMRIRPKCYPGTLTPYHNQEGLQRRAWGACENVVVGRRTEGPVKAQSGRSEDRFNDGSNALGKLEEIGSGVDCVYLLDGRKHCPCRTAALAGMRCEHCHLPFA